MIKSVINIAPKKKPAFIDVDIRINKRIFVYSSISALIVILVQIYLLHLNRL